jgi:hypothetical protein
MFQKISAIALRIEGIVNKTRYVFEVVTWSIETLRVIADRLRAFPKPANEEKDNISEPVNADAGTKEQQSGESGQKLKPVEGEN